jgi:hypothetical protein
MLGSHAVVLGRLILIVCVSGYGVFSSYNADIDPAFLEKFGFGIRGVECHVLYYSNLWSFHEKKVKKLKRSVSVRYNRPSNQNCSDPDPVSQINTDPLPCIELCCCRPVP